MRLSATNPAASAEGGSIYADLRGPWWAAHGNDFGYRNPDQSANLIDRGEGFKNPQN